MVKVYKWPPKVGIIASKWTTRKPIARSTSLISGAEYTSSMLRERFVASVRVGGWSFDYTGHGYMETLKELLDGGRNLVRLTEQPFPYMGDMGDQFGAWPEKLEWRGANYSLITWRTASGAELTWTTGQLYPATVQSDSRRYLRVRGLPPGMVIMRPGQRMVAVRMPDGPHQIVTATQRVVVAADGTAAIRASTEMPITTTHAVLRYRMNAAFRVDGELPEVETEINREPIWDWKFVQAFEDEVAGGFVEEDLW